MVFCESLLAPHTKQPRDSAAQQCQRPNDQAPLTPPGFAPAIFSAPGKLSHSCVSIIMALDNGPALQWHVWILVTREVVKYLMTMISELFHCFISSEDEAADAWYLSTILSLRFLLIRRGVPNLSLLHKISMFWTEQNPCSVSNPFCAVCNHTLPTIASDLQANQLWRVCLQPEKSVWLC